MSTPIESKRSPWQLPGMILWGFAPAILMSASVLGGWYGDHGIISPGSRYDEGIGLGLALFAVGLFGMPIILYAWSVVMLRTYTKKQFAFAALVGIPLCILMCGVNAFAGLAGCSALTNVVPQEGIF